MIQAIDHARHGIDEGVGRLNQAAQRIARDGAGGDLTGTVVELMRAEHAIAPNVAVVRAADEMIGTLLDVLA